MSKSYNSIVADGLQMRLVRESDAKFIVDLRTDDKLKRYISATSPNVDDQINWLKDYKKREAKKEEFYFIFEDSKFKRWGAIRLYNFVLDSFTIGSWICLPGNKNNIAVKANMLAVELGFEKFNFKHCLFEVWKKNYGVLSFYKLLGAVKTGEDDFQYGFRLDKGTYVLNRGKIMKILKFNTTSDIRFIEQNL